MNVLGTMGRAVGVILALLALAPVAFAAKTAAQIAFLVESSDAAAIGDELREAINAPEPLLRATAARVAAVRGVTAVLPALRARLASESDSSAAREEVRALILLGDLGDVDLAINATRALPPGIDDVIARAVARRADAVDLYVAKLRPLGFAPDAEFFMQALWQRGMLPVSAGARLLGAGDAPAWRALLAALRESHLAMDANVLGAALGAPSEQIRTDSVWYLVRAYALDPKLIPPRIREVLAAPGDPSLREAFGRELVARMLGAEKKDDSRWLDWLQSLEADELIGSETLLFEYFTDKEFMVRKNHCDVAANDCVMPPKRGTQIPSAEVAPPAFLLPGLLPPGLGDAVMAESRCNGQFMATARAVADAAGRVGDVVIQRIAIDQACERAVSVLMRLSLATPNSIAAPRETGNLVLVRAARQTLCLDEGPLDVTSSLARSVGGDVKAPILKKKVEPRFPESARRQMGGSRYVMVILSAVISKNGCIRSMQLLEQSPYPELNGAALLAFSQWRFEPGRLNGAPVDSIFHLSVRFLTK